MPAKHTDHAVHCENLDLNKQVYICHHANVKLLLDQLSAAAADVNNTSLLSGY